MRLVADPTAFLADATEAAKPRAIAAAPATDFARSGGRAVSTPGHPGWWADLMEVHDDALMARIGRVKASPLEKMPLRVAVDLGESEPVDDPELTARIVPMLQSSWADRSETWARHIAAIMWLGRSLWLRVEPGDFGSVPPITSEEWVSLSPLDVTSSPNGRTGEDRSTVTLPGGQKIEVATSRLVVCQRSGRLRSGEPWSDMRSLIGTARLSDHTVESAWHRVDQSGLATQIAAITGSSQRPARTAPLVPGSQVAEPQTFGESLLASLRERIRSMRSRSNPGSRSSRDPVDPRAREPHVIDVPPDGVAETLDLSLDFDGGLIDAGRWAVERMAAGAGIPTSELTGEQPKYANMFASRAQFLASDAASDARSVASAALPLLAAIVAADPELERLRDAASGPLSWWLDPTPLIDEARADATSTRGGAMAAAPTTVDEPTTSRELRRVNVALTTAEAALEELAALVADGDVTDPDRIAARLDAIVSRLQATTGPLAVGDAAEAARAMLDELGALIAERDGQAVAAVIGLPTFITRLLGRVKRALFGPSTADVPDEPPTPNPPIVSTRAATPLRTGGARIEWVYGLASDRERPYEPHQAADGLVGSQRGDFPGSEPDGAPIWPGGHAGCQCTAELAAP